MVGDDKVPAVPRALAAALALALAAAPAARPARADDLDPAVGRTAGITAGALLLVGGSELAKDSLAPSTCRWCDPTGVERDVRDALLWSDTAAASKASDVLVIAFPLALAGADLAMAGGDWRKAGEDALVVAESAALAEVATQVLKFATARRRPYAWASGARTRPDDVLSFPSGHTTLAFAVAGAFGTTAKLRGYQGWPFVYAGGFVAAAAVGWLRMAGDKHWLGDVAAGAAIGTASGLFTPLLLHRKEAPAPGQPSLGLSVVPLGVAGVF
jgi:membrane-associated phospholipid phosphatase